jgi:hypothetical protein
MVRLSAVRRIDGMVIYSKEGSQVQEQKLRPDQLRAQLFVNGGYSDERERFIRGLSACGSAEILVRAKVDKFGLRPA